jgi:hypothetical protein
VSAIKLTDFIVFLGRKKQRYGLIIEKISIAKHTKFDFKN